MEKEKNTAKSQPVQKYRYISHTLVRFTHNKIEIALQYGGEYSNLPTDSSIIQNLIDQKRLILI